MLDSIRHLFITGEDIDRTIAQSQDGRQDTNDDEDNASDADSRILSDRSDHIPHPTLPPLVLPPS